MKKLCTFFILLGLVLSVSVDSVLAHPGSNSWDGCHYCRTNCKKWGYTTNTRHCKNKKLTPQFGVKDPKWYR